VSLRGIISGAESGTRELFKPSKDLASLLVCNEKNFFGFGCGFFVSDVINDVSFCPFWPTIGIKDGFISKTRTNLRKPITFLDSAAPSYPKFIPTFLA